MTRRGTLSVTTVLFALALALAACAGTHKPCPPCAAAPTSTTSAAPAWPQHGDSKFVTVVVQWKLKAEFEQEALEYLRQFIAKAQANEPNLVLYALNKDPRQERTYYWIERYRDRAAVDLHRSADYRKEGVKLIPKWVEKWPPELFVELEQVIPY